MFVQMMLPHHEQGAQIVRLVKNRKVRKEVRELAEAIDVTQATEAENMAALLKEWKAPATAPEAAHAAHGGIPSTSPAVIDALAKASDVEFERQFLNLLIAHQDDAVQMALREKQGGIHEKARELADRIERSRKAQIALMLGYLR